MIPDVAVRIEIVGRGPNGFNYDLQLVPLKDAKEGDLETESNGLPNSNCRKKCPIYRWYYLGL